MVCNYIFGFSPSNLHRLGSPVVDTAILDAASVRSSPTLRALSPPPMSASPTAFSFYTPAQTPSGLGPAPSAIGLPPNETTKKKKSKKKKKTGSKPHGTANETTATEFQDQINEIDGIKTAHHSGSYYSRGAQEPAEHEHRPGEKVRSALLS
jgi:hypothetical protein